jgi:hypothetical protein
MFTPNQGYIAMHSRRLADADFTETGQDRGEDHAAHVDGKTCTSCGERIGARQPARRRGDSEWVHNVCPVTGRARLPREFTVSGPGTAHPT